MVGANDIRVGLFLAVRGLRRSSIWTSGLIIVVMTLTFLNLVVVAGILVGLIEGIGVTYKGAYNGDLFVSRQIEKTYIEGTTDIEKIIARAPGVLGWSTRYLASATIQSDYKTRTRLSDVPDQANAMISGIDPEAEDRVTNLSSYLIEGTYLDQDDEDEILVGANLFYKYMSFESPDLRTLKGADLGSRVRLTIGTSSREVTIKGILKSKLDEIDRRIFISDRVVRKLTGRTDLNASEIAIRIDPAIDPAVTKAYMIAAGADRTARVQLAAEGEPSFVKDIKTAFSLLGNVIGSVGIVVASITIFIVIFVNAITRRKFIGIMKGIGVSRAAIESSYVFQSFFYATVGTGIGLIILYLVLVPFFAAHPIDFPFSDGILVAPFFETGIRVLILLFATLVAGYIPARIVVKQNTLDAILGR